MKFKVLCMTALTIFAFASCQEDPAKHAEKEQEKHERAAQAQAESAAINTAAAAAQADAAVYNAVQAKMNENMKQVAIPELESSSAQKHLEKFGNHAVDFINANDPKSAGKYAEKINKDLEDLKEMKEEGEISENEATAIMKYTSQLAAAVGIEL